MLVRAWVKYVLFQRLVFLWCSHYWRRYCREGPVCGFGWVSSWILVEMLSKAGEVGILAP